MVPKFHSVIMLTGESRTRRIILYVLVASPYYYNPNYNSRNHFKRIIFTTAKIYKNQYDGGSLITFEIPLLSHRIRTNPQELF